MVSKQAQLFVSAKWFFSCYSTKNILLKKDLPLVQIKSAEEGTLWGTQYRNTAREIGKYRNDTVWKIDKIPIPRLDPLSGSAFLFFKRWKNWKTCPSRNVLLAPMVWRHQHYVFMLTHRMRHSECVCTCPRKETMMCIILRSSQQSKECPPPPLPHPRVRVFLHRQHNYSGHRTPKLRIWGVIFFFFFTFMRTFSETWPLTYTIA